MNKKTGHKLKKKTAPLSFGEGLGVRPLSLCRVLPLLVFVAAKHCYNKLEQKQSKQTDEQKIQRQLTVVSVIYHLAGIFYNE
jgi:hypothetical protein